MFPERYHGAWGEGGEDVGHVAQGVLNTSLAIWAWGDVGTPSPLGGELVGASAT